MREDLKHHPTDLGLGKHHPITDLLEQLLAIRMMGGETVSDTSRLKDDGPGRYICYRRPR